MFIKHFYNVQIYLVNVIAFLVLNLKYVIALEVAEQFHSAFAFYYIIK